MNGIIQDEHMLQKQDASWFMNENTSYSNKEIKFLVANT